MKRKIKQNKESGASKFTNFITPTITNRGISSIDGLWGLSVKNYKLDNLEDYEDKLKKMSTIDLEKHAGVIRSASTIKELNKKIISLINS